jgi:hypothetical protein
MRIGSGVFAEVFIAWRARETKAPPRIPTEDEGRRHLLKNKSAGTSLFWQHGIFHALADSKLQRGFGGNLNGFAGCRVAAFTCFTL